MSPRQNDGHGPRPADLWGLLHSPAGRAGGRFRAGGGRAFHSEIVFQGWQTPGMHAASSPLSLVDYGTFFFLPRAGPREPPSKDSSRHVRCQDLLSLKGSSSRILQRGALRPREVGTAA